MMQNHTPLYVLLNNSTASLCIQIFERSAELLRQRCLGLISVCYRVSKQMSLLGDLSETSLGRLQLVWYTVVCLQTELLRADLLE